VLLQDPTKAVPRELLDDVVAKFKHCLTDNAYSAMLPYFSSIVSMIDDVPQLHVLPVEGVGAGHGGKFWVRLLSCFGVRSVSFSACCIDEFLEICDQRDS
jgi:hypothetical protein